MDYEAAVRQKLARGEQIDLALGAGRTFGDFAEEWFKTYVTTNNRPSEQRGKRMKLDKHLLPFFGSQPIATITEADIEHFKKAKVQNGLSAKSINNVLTVLRRCLQSAAEWNLVGRVPRVQWLRVPPQRFDVLTNDEAHRLLAAAPEEPVYGDMILCALRTGMRIGEILALEWSDVDFDRRILHVTRSFVRGVVDAPKNNRARTIPISGDLLSAFERRARPEGLVFPSSRGTHITYRMAERGLGRAQQRAGLRPFGWHCLRHTFASQLVTAGVSMRAVQELLGHSTIVMTTRYAHLGPSALRQAISVLEPAAPIGGNQGSGYPS